MKDPRRFIRIIAAAGAGTLSAAVAIAALSLPGLVSAAPQATQLYVTTTGSDASVNCAFAAPCLTIQRAVNIADNGDTVNVMTGTFGGPVNVTETLTLLGMGNGNTIVDGANTNRLFKLESSVTISGFTIQNGDSDGGSAIWANIDPNFAAAIGPVNIINNRLLTNKATIGGFPIGSAIKVDGALVNVTNNLIQGNARSAVRVAGSAGVTFTGNTFQNNTSDTDGAAMWLDGQTVFTVNNNTFTGNSGDNGGAIAVSKLVSAGLILSNTFQNNTAIALGGAIYVNGVTNTLSITGNQILSNTAGRGAGIGSTGPSTFLISNNDIGYNKITGGGASGGGIHFDTGAGGTVNANNVHHNQAPTGFGGGIDVDVGGATIFNNNQIYNNSVPTNTGGGGVRVTGVASTQFVGNLIFNNTGNGLFVANTASAIISANLIMTNSARTDGGGVRVVGVNALTFKANTLSNNSVSYLFAPSTPRGFAGGLDVISSTGVIENNIFTGNKSGDYDGGGAIGITERSTVTVRNNTFTGNQAEFGSVVAVLNPTGGNTVIDSNLMTGNRQNAPGGLEDGVIEIRGAATHPVTISNNVLANNSLITFTQAAVPATGTGVRCGEGTSSPVVIINNTFYKNGDRAINLAGTENIGELPCSATVTLINNIIADHTSAGIKKGTGSTVVLSTTYNVFSTTTDAAGSVGATGNITANPLFSSTVLNDFRLKIGSPAIDAGTNTNAPAKDILGVARPFGAKVDAGAYEFTAQISQTIVLSLPVSKLTTSPAFTVSAVYSSAGAATFSAGPANVCTIAGNTLTPVASGTCVVTGTAPADTAYFSATATGSFPINKAPQSIALVNLPANKLTTDAPFTVTAAFSAIGTATFGAGPASVCSNSSNTITLLGSGVCTITATAPTDAIYLAATITGSVSVSKVTQTITFDPLPNKVITDAQFTVIATASSNLSVTFSAGGVCTISSGVATLTGVTGICTITATQTGNATFLPAANVVRSFNVSDPAKQNQTINFTTVPTTVTISSTLTLTAAASSNLSVTFASLTPAVCSVAGHVVTPLSTGTCTIAATQSGDNAFNPAPAIMQSFEVTLEPVDPPVDPPKLIYLPIMKVS